MELFWGTCSYKCSWHFSQERNPRSPLLSSVENVSLRRSCTGSIHPRQITAKTTERPSISWLFFFSYGTLFVINSFQKEDCWWAVQCKSLKYATALSPIAKNWWLISNLATGAETCQAAFSRACWLTRHLSCQMSTIQQHASKLNQYNSEKQRSFCWSTNSEYIAFIFSARSLANTDTSSSSITTTPTREFWLLKLQQYSLSYLFVPHKQPADTPGT